jgi:hypothetical protein
MYICIYAYMYIYMAAGAKQGAAALQLLIKEAVKKQ